MEPVEAQPQLLTGDILHQTQPIQQPQLQEEPEPTRLQVVSGGLPPLKMTAKPPPMAKDNRSLVELRDDNPLRKHGYSVNKKVRDERFLHKYIENQRRKMASVNIPKDEERKPIFKSTKVDRPAKVKPVEMRPQLRQMKEEYKMREQSIERFLSHSDLLDDYKMLSHLGKGSFSVVGLAVSRQTNRRFAVKTYAKIDEMDDYKFDNIYREINHLKQLEHQNIVNLYHVVKDKRKLLLVMEDAGKLSLAGLLRKNSIIPESKVRPIFRQVLQGVQHCHQQKICHRDIKLENVLIDGSEQVRLIDFGFSSKCGERLKNFCGTPPYMSPEIASKLPYHGEPADMWAVGILLYMMLFGKFPFRATSEKELYRLIQQGKFELNDTISPDAKETLRKLLKCSSRERATASQVLEGRWLREAPTA